MAVSLIQEQTEPQLLQEAVQGYTESGNLKVKGIAKLQSFDTVNQNKRVYSQEIGQKFLQEALNKINDPSTSFMGEWDHPMVDGLSNAAQLKRQMSIMLKEASHQFTNVWLENNIMYGDLATLSTPNGITMASVIVEDHIPVAFSARALGKTKPAPKYGSGVVEVYGPILLCGYDCVQNPSHKGSVLTEVTNIVKDGKNLKMVSEANDGMLSEAFSDLILYNDLFLSESNTLTYLVENFIRTDNYKKSLRNKNDEKRLLEGTMDSLLMEYLNTTPEIDGAESSIKDLNESNVREFMDDYCNYRDNFLSVGSMKTRAKKILGL